MNRYTAPIDTLDRMRFMVSSDEYAATFQSLDQYRTAILKHLDNLAAAQLAAAPEAKEPHMNTQAPLVKTDAARAHQINAGWAAAMTTTQIVYADVPEALQAIDYLVALAAFAQDSGKPIPAPPAPRAPEVQATAAYHREDAETFAQALIAQGWHNGSETCVVGLHDLLQGFLRTHGGEVNP